MNGIQDLIVGTLGTIFLFVVAVAFLSIYRGSRDPHYQRGFLWYERDGDFNPGWAGVLCFDFMILLINFVGLIAVDVQPDAWPVLVALLTTNVSVVLIHAIMVLKLAKAKLLAPALAKTAGSIAQVGAKGVGGIDFIYHDDERG